MTRETRRQAGLLATLGIALVVYLRYGAGLSLGGGGDATPASLPPIDALGLENALKDVSTVEPGLLVVEHGPSDPDRNLFQYGVYKPPPPTPAEIEARRQAAQAELARQEAEARAQKAAEETRIAQQQAAAEAARIAAEQAAANPPEPVKPQPPPKPQPPEVQFKYVGLMGDIRKPLGVFMDGNTLFLARKGQVVREKFRIIEVGVAWVDVGWVDPQFKDVSPKRIDLGS